MHFIYPRDLAEPQKVEEIFRDETRLLQGGGHGVSLTDTDAFLSGAARFAPPLPEGMVTYRGWMLTPTEYEALTTAVTRAGGTPQTTPAQYLDAHYLPRWYPRLSDLTPETVFFADADNVSEAEMVTKLQTLSWPAYFVKDWVKSHKTGRGSVLQNANELPDLLAEMRKYRGELEGGVCVRRFEEFAPGSETRYFVLRGQAFGPDANVPVPEVVSDCARRVSCLFFTVDVALRTDGVLRVVEIGDGQVSDLVGWTPERFAALWRDI